MSSGIKLEKVTELFHGSNQAVQFPDVEYIDNGDLLRAHHRDFGMGFYLHFDKTNADEWARVVRAMKSYGQPTTNRYLFKYRSDLQVFYFDRTLEIDVYHWLDYILFNRGYVNLAPNNPLSDVKYDIVVGPIADNEYGKSIQLLIDGDIPGKTLKEKKRKFIEGDYLLLERLDDQLCFKTKLAERALRYI